MREIVFDHSKLCGRIVEKFGTQREFSKQMGMSEGTLSSRLTGRNSFSADEILKACQLLDIDAADASIYFFTEKVE